MERIKEFFRSLFEKEKEAIYYSGYKEKLDEYNSLVKELNKNVVNEMPPLMRLHETPPYSERFYKEIKEFDEPITPRHLYKITHYQNGTYGDLWACFVSVDNPGIGQTKILHSCFIVTLIDDDLKIVAQFNPDRDTGKWAFVGGDRELKMYKLGKLLSIERYLEPVNDDWGIEQYNKDI
ncbi:hypothetical protein [Chryseobacterium indoltheticum]|uniref:hypothetical protein n=1 Tax=Chryseobacterium indoltheticum TaxID=254 RepID=UPI0040437FFA